MIGSLLRRSRIAPRLLARWGSRCCASTMGAGKSGLIVLTRTESAVTPPADDPTTTSSRASELVLSLTFWLLVLFVGDFLAGTGSKSFQRPQKADSGRAR